MEIINYSPFGFVLQAGASSHPKNVGGDLVYHHSDGHDERIPIQNPDDGRQIQELLPKAKARNRKATEKLASLIKPYSPKMARAMLASIGKYDDESDPMIVQGDELADGGNYMPDLTAALDMYRLSAKHGNHCGMCRLGCCYAEGKGCYKNKRLAKYWIEKAATQCEEADEYLDIYKLR